jgi:hypothetical protein
MTAKDTTQNNDPEYKEYLENRKSFSVMSSYAFFADEEVPTFETFIHNFKELTNKFTQYEIAKVTKNEYEVDGCFQYSLSALDHDIDELRIIISYRHFESLPEYKKRKEKDQTRREKNKASNEKRKLTRDQNKQKRILELRKELEKLEKE